MMTMRTFVLLAVAAIFASTMRAADPRIVETTSGIVGLARRQMAMLNVVDDGATGSPPLYALLAILDGTSNVLVYRTVALTRGKVESLAFRQDGSAERIPVRALVRFYGARTDVSKPFLVTFELVDDDDGKTKTVISCPNDFAFAGNPGGRGDVFNCPTECNVKLVAPGS
jgi:hypothetical protein